MSLSDQTKTAKIADSESNISHNFHNNFRVLTGLQATGELHLGNYFGALLPILQKAQENPKNEFFLFVPDLHTLTIDLDYENFAKTVWDNLRTYLAAASFFEARNQAKNGKSNQNKDQDNIIKNVTFYRQSRISAHSELAWILSCFAPFGQMERMTQFKDKSSEHRENINCGLFCYPILMTADILLYDAKYVPVGADQQQHLELARDIAIRLNHKFSAQNSTKNPNQTQNSSQETDEKEEKGVENILELFVVPGSLTEQNAFFKTQFLRIRSLTNPEKKMSKSDSNPKSKILLTDEPNVAKKKILSATTDSKSHIPEQIDEIAWQEQPGICNLLLLGELLCVALEKTKLDFAGMSQYGQLKAWVADLVEEFLTEFQSKMTEISDRTIVAILEQGEDRARRIAEQKLRQVQQKLGLWG